MAAKSSTRDNQRQRLYDAEDAAMVAVEGWCRKQTIANDDLQAYVDTMLAHQVVQRRWGLRRIRVGLTHDGARATHLGSEIRLGVGTRNPWVICHEVAHCLTPSHVASHGPEFAGIYLFLVKTFIGAPAAVALRQSFVERKVRRSNVAIPDPTGTVVTKTERAKQATEAKRRKATEQTIREMTRCNEDNRLSTAGALRAQIKHGVFGPAGSTARKHALAAARHLEGAEARVVGANLQSERRRLIGTL